MFSKLALFAVSAIALSVSALPTPGDGQGQCNTGPIQCCNSIENSNSVSAPVTALLGLLSINVGSITGQIGISCSPLDVIGASSCNSQPICCENNNYNGVVVIGCSPITL